MAVSRSCGNTIRKLFAAPARAVLASLLLVLALLTMRGAQAVDLSEAAHGMLSLAPHVAIIEDPERALRFEDVRSPALADRYIRYPAAESFNFGITESAYWVRLSLENKSEHPAQAMVEIAYSRLGRLDWHEVKVDGDSAGGVRILRTGYARPYAERPHSGRNFVFPVSIEAGGQRTIYLRVESELPVSLPLRLWTREAFQIHERNDYIVQAAFFGMVLALAAFNLLLYIGLRDGNYVIYLAYALPVSLAISAINGLGAEFLWPDSPRWITISFSVLVHVSSLSLVLFMRRMIGMGAVSPRLDRAMAAVMWLNAGAAVVALLSYQIKLTLLVAFVTAVAILVGSGSCAKAGSRAARIFLLAFLALGLAMLVTSLRVAGLIADTVFSLNAIQAGIALEMVLLAFALVDRFQVLRAEKEQAQASALAAERALVESLRKSERELEMRVHERTAELSSTVDRLQQTQNELVEAEKMASLGSLVAGVAHEINTPIGNALTTATTLEQDSMVLQREMSEGALRRSILVAFVEKNLAMARLLTRSCERVAELVSSFKQVAVDQTSEARRAFDLRETIEDNLAALRPNLKHVGWRIELDIAQGIACNSYPGPLGQVIVNLINNAGAHAFEGRDAGVVRISAAAHGDNVDLVVSDDGAGMSAETLRHIFDPFFTTKLGQGGSGLGLSICRNIVVGMLGGEMSASSEPGRGTRFSVRFPRQAPERKAHEPERTDAA